MRYLILIAAIAMMTSCPGIASATYNGEPDRFGIYFDADGYWNFATEHLYTPFPMYLVLHNPTAPFDGFECTVTPSSTLLFMLSTSLSNGAVDADPSAGGFAVTAAAAYPIINDSVLLCTWQCLVSGPGPIDIYVRQATNPSLPGGLPIVTSAGVPRLCPVSNCDVRAPVAGINGAVPIYYGCAEYDPTSRNIGSYVTVSAPGLDDADIHAGTRSNATDDRDLSLDFPTPGPSTAGYLLASFEHPDWPGGPRFRNDVRARFNHNSTYRMWPILVETDVAGPVTLRFSDGGMYATAFRDMQTGEFHFLAEQSTCTFANDGQPRNYRFQLFLGTTSAAAGVAPGAAGRTGLAAQPNPFNPQTTFTFELPATGPVRLAVFDAAGRLVRTLVDSDLPPGRGEATWDGRDAAGRSVGSGTYLARIEYGGKAEVVRVGLVR